jgi:hypothetical protein
MSRTHEPHHAAPPDYSLAGKRLSDARQAHGFSAEEAARFLHLKPELVLALEQGALQHIPGGIVYARGHLRMYARILGLDPEELLRFAPPPPQSSRPAASLTLSRSEAARSRVAIFVSLGALLLVIAAWYFTAPHVSGQGFKIRLIQPVPSELAAYLKESPDRAPGKNSPCLRRDAAPAWPPCYTLERHDWPEEALYPQALGSVLYLSPRTPRP